MAGRQLLLSEKGTTPALNEKLPLTFVFKVGGFGYWYFVPRSSLGISDCLWSCESYYRDHAIMLN